MTALGPGLRRLIEAFEKLGISFFAGGSLASSVHGMPRATRDVDLVADLTPSQAGALVREIGGEFYLDPDTIRDALAAGRPFNLIHFESSYKFDIFPLPHDAYHLEEFARRQFQPVRQWGDDFSLPVASAEDTILSKLVWFRKGGEVSEREWADARGVVEVQKDRLDMAYMRGWSVKLGIHDLLERLLVETGMTAR